MAEEENDEVIMEDLPEDHPRMVAFQKALTAVLQRQLARTQEQLKEAEQLYREKKGETAKAGKRLHEEQKKLVLEEEAVRVVSRKLDTIKGQRIQTENEAKELRKEVEQLTTELEAEENKTDVLREQVQ